MKQVDATSKTQIALVISRIIHLRNEALKRAHSDDQLILLSQNETAENNLRAASLAVIRSSNAVTELLEVEGIQEWFEDPSQQNVEELLDREAEQLKEIEGTIQTRLAEIASLSERIRLKEAELERTERRFEDLRAHAKIESSDDELLKELKKVYAEYVTRFQNMEFINYELTKLRDTRSPPNTGAQSVLED